MKIKTEFITDYLTCFNKSKYAFCKMCSISIKSLNCVLNNNKNVRAINLCKIVNAIGINLKLLIGY